MQYAFYFDSRACSGCKACQIACQDKHGLAAGQSWRRVHEVSGGEWRQAGSAWVPDLFAYHVSIACNHCEKPICVEVCPARALTKRADGIVMLDTEKCLGCGYCSWACPYDALQPDSVAGHMTKCTFCVDKIDAGQPPECIAACPMRVLDFGDRAALAARHGGTNGSLPLPDPALTQPALVIRPHKDAARSRKEPVQLFSAGRRSLSAGSLVAFTLLAQLAVGGLWVLILLQLLLPTSADLAQLFSSGALAFAGVMMAGLAVSLLHLGKLSNAYRALANLRSSWLSREIGCAILFAGATWILVGTQRLEAGTGTLRAAIQVTVLLLGMVLIYSMARIYMLRTVPRWDRPATLFSFTATAVLTGGLAVTAVALSIVPVAGAAVANLVLPSSLVLLLLLWFWRWRDRQTAGMLSLARHEWLLPLLGAVCIGLTLLLGNIPTWITEILSAVAFIIVFSGEVSARSRFYREDP